MAKKNEQEFVQHITPRSVDFSQWYTDVILQTGLCDYAPVRGCMIIKPYGYAIGERIQAEMDKRFKATGHENCYSRKPSMSKASRRKWRGSPRGALSSFKSVSPFAPPAKPFSARCTPSGCRVGAICR